MKYTTILFDLDDTLYPSDSGLWLAIRDRMNQYLHERVGIPLEEVPELRKHYYETYGTTLRGLQRHHHVDSDDFLAYVHDLPLPSFIRSDPAVREIILSLPQDRWIFTNADDKHAERVLAELNLADCFKGIIDIRAVNWTCKPEEEAYRNALQIAGVTEPYKCVVLDDALRNLKTAKSLGLTTVLVGESDEADHCVDLAIPSLLSLPEKMPVLWEPSELEEI